jgi:sporulation protein YlmC with PRC-barrel domain
MQPAVLSASTLTGDPVVNHEGERLGTLKEIMIDLDRGEIGYAVLSRGELAGIGERLFAVPWSLFTVDTAQHQLLLDIDAGALDDAQGFDPDDWPRFDDQDWGGRLHDSYGVTPYWSRGLV